MLDEKELNKNAASEQAAPAVVGQLSVSNELLDFSGLAKKSSKKKECLLDGKCEDNELTPRERAILARKKK
ncbi:hypothetical protein [Mycoplasmopsis columbinasalis]|uniref:Uncharacterized protein n=1 Tax=Mycoplasmopsis columbinasalis TaxID=114880 RepID=A0A449B9M7_9BACT|nr:hypothetical protein [Mycoplasmopsis columbinasalis]VEU77883.1 Uncharacterised protein [Mycoplasmopsis columbinasalis]